MGIGSDDDPSFQAFAYSDDTPDLDRGVFAADAPAIRLDDGTFATFPIGSIFAKRFGAHTWLTWNDGTRDGVGSNVSKWNFDLTLKKTSAPGVTPMTFTVINGGIGFGDQYTPLTVAEAWHY